MSTSKAEAVKQSLREFDRTRSTETLGTVTLVTAQLALENSERLDALARELTAAARRAR